MSRIETIGNATLYLGDCREIAPGLSGIAATLSDPPYGINHKVERTHAGAKWSKRSSERVTGDEVPFDPLPWIGGPAVLWGANYYADKLPPSGGWLVFDKRRNGTHNQKFIASDCELAWSNVMGRVRTFSHLWDGLCRDSEVGRHFHPTQKPVALMEWCLQFLPPGTVLDPYMGSGSTGIAAVRAGRPFVGIEIEQKYFDTACRRVESEARQSELFLHSNANASSE